MNYIFLDTCVFLDISTKKQDLAFVSALEELVKTDVVKLVVTDLIAEEYERNKEDVANKTAKQMEFLWTKNSQ